MRELENLKELYVDEIRKINKKGELTPADDAVIEKALERIEKLDEMCCRDEDDMHDEYSERYSEYMPYRRRMPDMYPKRYSERYSERRGRSATTGRYISRHDGSSVDRMIRKLEMMKYDAPDSETMTAIDNVISKLEDY